MSDGPFLVYLIFGLAFVVSIAFAVVASRKERERREALAALAGRLGFSFSSGHNTGLAQQFQEFRGMGLGENRYAFNVMEGDYLGRHLTAFDFHYSTSSTDSKGHRTTHHHYFQVVVLRLDREFPRLFIAPEGMFSKIAQAFGYDDIDFESHEFSRRFCVRSADRKFAFDFCNTSMMDFLLAHPDTELETRDGQLVSMAARNLTPQRLESDLELVCSVRDRMPAYLFATA